jgi:hypothetical protein
VGWAVTLLVLVAIVILAAASFFRNMLVALTVLVAIPVAIVLHTLMGTLYAIFTLGLVAVVVALTHTIFDTLGLLRTAKRRRRRARPALAERRTSTGRSDRSRIAA